MDDDGMDLIQQLKNIRASDKFSVGDSEYLSRRQAFSTSVQRDDLWPIVDHFGLYVGVQTLASKLATYDILRLTLDVPGHVMEFGCWNGSNLMFIAKILQLLRPNSTKQVIGFDSFEGLTTFADADGQSAQDNRGRYRGNEEVLREAIRFFGFQDWVHLVKGDARETIPAYAKEFPDTLISFAYIDFDLYEPTKAALEFIADRLSIGGIVVFDEAVTNAWPGEGQALVEFLRSRDRASYSMHTMSFARQPTLYMVRR